VQETKWKGEKAKEIGEGNEEIVIGGDEKRKDRV